MKNIFIKIVTFAILLTLTICPLNIVNGEENSIKVIIDGKELVFDVEPTIDNGRLLVPLRAIFESLNADITWDGESQTITAIRGNKTIKLTIDKDISYVNGEECPLDVPAKIISGRTLVPVRFVSESLGENVEWNGDTRTVFITTSNNNRGNSVGNISNFGFIVENNDNIFYIYDSSQIIRINKENSEKDIILEAEGIDSLNLIGDKLFYNIYGYEEEVDEGIYVININDSEVQKLCDDSAWDINIVNECIYYINGSDDCTIYKMNLDGSEKQKIHSYAFYNLAVEGDWMYVVNSLDDYKLYKLKIDGTELIELDNEHIDCTYINISGEWVYYISKSENGIFRTKEDGTQRQKLSSEYVSCINVDNNHIYFLYKDYTKKGYLCKMEKNGQNLTVLDSTFNDCYINLSNNKIYCIAYHPYYDSENNSCQELAGLYCIDLDGNIKKKLELSNIFECQFTNNNKTNSYDVLITKDLNSPLIPIDKFRRMLGLKSSVTKYEKDTKEIIINGDNILKMTLDNNKAYFNDEIVYLSDFPTMLDGKVYIPIKFALKAYNLHIMFDTLTDKYFIIDNENFAKVKELLERSIIDMSKIDKYKTTTYIDYTFDSEAFDFSKVILLVSIIQDNKEEISILNYNLIGTLRNGGVSNDKKATFYYKGNCFTQYYPSEIWLEEDISSVQWDLLFSHPTPVKQNDIAYFNNLKIIEEEDGFISLKGEIDSENYDFLINNTIISDDIDYTVESFDVEIIVEKETNYIHSSLIKMECNVEGEKFNVVILKKYSEFNGDFDINIPENFTVESN